MLSSTAFVVAASFATLAFARTDLTGCTSTDVSSPAGASIAWYVPGTGELCDFLDCGGGRAPPKTTVPGCPLYSGTLTYSPSFLPGYGSATAAPAATSSASAGSITSDSQSLGSTVSESTSTESSLASYSSASSSVSMSSITPYPIAPVGGNATANGGVAIAGTTAPVGNNITVASGTPSVASGIPSSSTISDSGAMETARMWASGASLMGLGALVMAL